MSEGTPSGPRESGLRAVNETYEVLYEIENCIEDGRYRDAAEAYDQLGVLASMGHMACLTFVRLKNEEN